MSYAEEKAEEWAYDKVKELMLDGTIPADAGTLEIAEYGYLAGYAEAMRWRDPVKEPPPVDTVLQWRYFYEGGFELMCFAGILDRDRERLLVMRFDPASNSPIVETWTFGDSILWRPIGPLPEGEK